MNDIYVTRDLGEAAALLTEGCRMGSLQWKDKVAYFSFSDKKECEQISRDYFSTGFLTDARRFYENLRLVKSKLYENDTPRQKHL